MISKEDLLNAKNENLEKIAELQAENRVFDKLIAIENSKEMETVVASDETENVVENGF